MARHSSPTLTARYSHPRLNDMASAAEKLPRFLQSQTDAMKATGTDGKHAAQHVAQHVVPPHISSHRDASPCTREGPEEVTADCRKSLEDAPLSIPLHSDALECA